MLGRSSVAAESNSFESGHEFGDKFEEIDWIIVGGELEGTEHRDT